MSILSLFRKAGNPTKDDETGDNEDPQKRHGTLYMYFVDGHVVKYSVWTTGESWMEDGSWWADLDSWYTDHTNPEPFRLSTEEDDYVTLFYRQNITQIEIRENVVYTMEDTNDKR